MGEDQKGFAVSQNVAATSEEERSGPLLRLLELLAEREYRFVTVTPATHARVLARPYRRHADQLADALGWSLPFAAGSIDPQVEALLEEAGALEVHGDQRRSRLRVSSLHDRLFLHSAYPTLAADSVFFGPDSYRFADLIVAELTERPAPQGAHMVDIGAGAGVGAIVAADLCAKAGVAHEPLWMTDINATALDMARINAAAAGHEMVIRQGKDMADMPGMVDLALANPPFIMDADARHYRDGGEAYGAAASIDIARSAAARLKPGGRLILYSGSAIVGGKDGMKTGLEGVARALDCTLRYREIDPDIFGEELEGPLYAEVDRIAAVAAVLERSAGMD